MNDLYRDIMNHPHHISQKHPQMSRQNRAAQFSPFSSLSGYGDLITESARITNAKRELSEDERSEINLKLKCLWSCQDERPKVSIRYYVKDERKDGGSYCEVSGVIEKFLPQDQLLILESGIVIPFEDIARISSDIFDKFLFSEG